MSNHIDYSLYEGMSLKGGGTVVKATPGSWTISHQGGAKKMDVGADVIKTLKKQLQPQYHKALTSSPAWKEAKETKIKETKMDIAYNRPVFEESTTPLRTHGTTGHESMQKTIATALDPNIKLIKEKD